MSERAGTSLKLGEGQSRMSYESYTPARFAHQWLPERVELRDWGQIAPYYEALDARDVSTREGLETFLRDYGELGCAVQEEGARRYIAMTCQTDDRGAEAAHLAWVREVEPKLKPVLDRMRSKYLDSPARGELPAERFRVFDRQVRNLRELYREENVARESALAELEQRYQKVSALMTVSFQGEERTLQAMRPFLEEGDRAVRREAWTQVAERRLRDRDAIDGVFDEMLSLREAIAGAAGFSSFVEYVYRQRERFDYGVAEARAFQDAIEAQVVPFAAELLEERRVRLGVESLRPWDLEVDPLGRPPLRPFETAEQLAERAQQVFADVDSEFGAQFGFMRAQGLLDLANRKGKAPGGYQETLQDRRLPFIFMNAVGVDDDVRTMLHEGGHAFHTFASRHEELAAYRDAPIEFCEVASMSMELLSAPYLSHFYDESGTRRSYRQLLEGIVLLLPWIATVDAFQHWIYEHPAHSRAERRAAWRDLMRRFGGPVDWSGLDEALENLWHKQRHIFLNPFYYIEYGIAQLGALAVWRHSRDDAAGAVARYKEALALGGSRPLPELFAAAGAPFEFTTATIAPLMDAVRAELARLEE